MPKLIMFWKPDGPNGICSQWYPSEFTEGDITFTNAEQYMMYHKAMLFGDGEIAKKILRTSCPKTMKSLGRKVANFDEDVWAQNRERIVLQGTWLKFSQNEALKQFLMKCPADGIFIEASPYDKIWGIGFASHNALSNKQKWGLNLLGKALNVTYDKFIHTMNKNS